MVTRSAELRDAVRALAPAWARQELSAYWLMSDSLIGPVQDQLVGDRLLPCDASRRAELVRVMGRSLPRDEKSLLLSTSAATSDPVRTIAQLLESFATGRHNRLIEQFTVRHIVEAREGFKLISNNGVAVRARQVVAAPGAWSTHGPFRATALQHSARTKKVVAFSLSGMTSAERLVLNLEDSEAFVLGLGSRGGWWLSITSDHWTCSADPQQLSVSHRDLSRATSILAEELPGVPIRITAARVAADVYLAEHLPLVEPMVGCVGAVLATGGGGSGFRLAPAIAEKALDLLGFPGMDSPATVQLPRTAAGVSRDDMPSDSQ